MKLLICNGIIMRMKKIKENKTYILLCVFYIVYYITLGVFAPYLNVYYERLGFSGSKIGLINSLGLIASMIVTPLWGAISDKTRSPKGMIAFLMMATGISAFFFSMQKAFLPVLVLSIILSMFRYNVWSLIDGVGIECCSAVQKDFGFARSMGSVGYLLGSFVIANTLNSFGISGPYLNVMIIFSFLGAVLIFIMPSYKPTEKKKSKISFTESVKTLFTNKNYVFVLIMMLLTSMVVDCILNYSGNHLINTLHQNDSMIGIFSCAQVLPEVIIVMFANRIFRKMNTRKIFMLGAAAQAVRFFLCALSSNVVVFLLATTLHGITIAVSSVGYVSYIHKQVDSRILATAMALYGTVNTIGSILINQLFGFVYQYSSSYDLFWIGFICALAAAVMVFFNKQLED